MRVAIYARVSTDDRGQDPENHLRELRAWCASAGHEIVQEYVEHESGRKGDGVCRQDQHALSNGLPVRTVQNAGLDTRPQARVAHSTTAAAAEKGQ
jgi:DNA invertase Pin-like site-specific DNA recombinase